MMRSRWSRWLSGIGAVILSGGVLVASLVFVPAEATAIDLQAWDTIIESGGSRFEVLPKFNNQAVLDKETQLVWERSPATTSIAWNNAGPNARINCADKAVGGRKGWRLPSLPELASLVDPSVGPPGPTLPPGHPFMNVQSNFYWSASTNAEFPDHAWGVAFDSGIVGGPLKTLTTPNIWCVRGGMNADQY